MATFAPIVISTGLQLLTSLFKKGTEDKQIDLRTPNVNLGKEIPSFFGKVRIETTIIAPKTPDKMYRVETNRSKGKGMASTVKKTVYGTWLSLISSNPCTINEVIINGQHISTSHSFYTNHCTFFDGTQTTAWSEIQLLYPTSIEADIAYTGLTLLGFKDVNLEKMGNVVPQQISVIATDNRLGTEPSIATVVETICNEAGIPSTAIDVSELFTTPLKGGFNVIQSGEGFRKAIEQLMQFFQFGAVWEGGKVKFKKFDRGAISPVIINPNDFLPTSDIGGNTADDGSSDRYFVREKEDTQSLPNKLNIKYFNINNNYEQDTFTVVFPEYSKENAVDIDTTLSTYPYFIEENGMALLKLNYRQNRLKYTFRTSPNYSNINPLDTVQLLNGEICQVLPKTTGNDFSIDFVGFFYSGQKNYGLTPPYEQLPTASPSLPDPTALPDIYILDIPQFENNPPATLYILASLSATLTLSFDSGDSYPNSVEHIDVSTIGDCTTSLPNVTGLDAVNTVDIILTSGDVEQITQNQFDDGQNLALLGKLNGNGFYEGKLIRFRDITLNAPNQYTISYIYQGDYNTSDFDTSSLPLKFFLLRSPTTSYYSKIERNIEDLNKPLQILPVVSEWQDLGLTPTTNVTSFNNNAYVTPPVTNINSEIDSNDNINILWDDTYANLSPYKDGSEEVSYQLEIYTDALYTNLVRTEVVGQTSYYYRIGDQTNDGVLPLPFYVKIARINAVSGLGAFVSATISSPTFVATIVGLIDADLLEGEDGTFYLDRTNHTGTQLASTISDFDEAVDDRASNLLVAGDNISLDYDDIGNTLTITGSDFPTVENNISINYTVLSTDHKKHLRVSNAVTITLPNGLADNFEVIVRRIGTDNVTIDTEVGGSLEAPGTIISEQYRTAHFYHQGSNVWIGTGYLTS